METLKTKKDLCEILKISLSTLNNWMKSGKVKYIKIGNNVRFCDKEIERLKRGE